MEEPKPRPITLEAHVLAYLGDYMNLFEESIKRLAQQELSKKSSAPPKQTESSASPFKEGESKPGDPKYTASARNLS